ncbi:SDR family oxidoreductase [Agromyces mediolanus]|uniref:Nucleoside-diphosphate sugar epimerase n=1 Tax=Agromyces mediolanus TaxID=41986 RepID=A0A918CLX2_AGRME|nr:NAD(P)H-binding protein [Agromyces mediolanus]GGR31339.1 nucleoside-diphosphate sugar epimerase [Agromyces mediolanus]GLJ72494.1 nucleoside-diphosphate sugar epimerase [Agromyces mediolanus]
MRIAIAGGTGTVGRHIVEVARERGHETVVLARSAGVDLTTGAGLAAALAGVDAVVDAANVNAIDRETAERFFTGTSRTLLAAEREAGVGHHVLLSIVGIDRIPYAYYEAKLAQEGVVEAGGVPYTILRATQFHEFAGQMAGRLRVAGIQLAARMRTQPIAAREVAEHLVALAEGTPRGRARDLAGPREEQLAELIRRLVRAEGRRGPVLPVSLPIRGMGEMRRGAALPGPDAELGRQTFAEWLADR